MSGKIEGFTEDDLWKYVRFGKKISVGPQDHVSHSGKLLGTNEKDPNRLRRIIDSTGEEVDMGKLRRNILNQRVTVEGESTTLNYPGRRQDIADLKRRTAERLKREYPDEEFEARS